MATAGCNADTMPAVEDRGNVCHKPAIRRSEVAQGSVSQTLRWANPAAFHMYKQACACGSSVSFHRPCQVLSGHSPSALPSKGRRDCVEAGNSPESFSGTASATLQECNAAAMGERMSRLQHSLAILQSFDRLEYCNVCYACPSFCPSLEPSHYFLLYPTQTQPGACVANIVIHL